MPNKITTENNFIYLTLALLLLLFASAVIEQYAGGGQGLITASTVLMLVIGIFSIRSERRWFQTGQAHYRIVLHR